MNILINLQAFDDNEIYNELVRLSKKEKIKKIYLASSLMHTLEKNIFDKYSEINKVDFLNTNNVFCLNKMNDVNFNLKDNFLLNEEYLYTDIISSYRWLPIAKRSDNDVFSFTMIFYYDVYNYWNNFFDNNEIDCVIQLNEEHSSLDSILIRVAKEYKVNKIITSRPVGAFTANSEEYHALYDNNKEEYINIFSNKKDSSMLDENSNFAVFSDAYKNTLKDKIVLIYRKLLELIDNKDLAVKQKINQVWNKLGNKIVTQIKLYYQYRYVKKLKKYYGSLAVDNMDVNSNYIYYCLHFDPEAATLPKDNAHANQLLNIRILASSLPKGWKLYVKEHPHQVDDKIYFGYLLNQLHSVDNFRSENFYKYISSLENVELVGLHNNHQKLLKNAEFIASNTGTVFREASYLKKQCITFSKNSFYEMLPNVHKVDDASSCRVCIKKYANSISLPEVDELFDKYSVTISNIKQISSRMLKEIIKLNEELKYD